MRMRSLAFVLAFTLFSQAPAALQAASRIEYILDVSGSMNAVSSGEKRIDAAKKSIASMVQGIPDGTVVALRLYAHRIAPSDKAGSCQDTELVIPFGPINKQQFMTTVNATVPLGQTPIAYSLEKAAADFTPGADEQQSIILVSDGGESCGGDPVAVAKGLIAKGFKLKINIIGLDVDAAAKNQLAAIASATGGQYFDARDTASLTGSLQKLTQESLVIQKAGSSVYGEEIRGGDNYETAVLLPVGKLFRLNHHQRVNQYDYFYVEAKPGQQLIVSLETGEKGVNIKEDNSYVETLSPYAGIGLHSPKKTEIRHEEIIGGKNDARQIVYSVPSDGQGRYYILVGSAYDAQHKDHRFKVEIKEQFDAGTQQDAGDSRDTALTVQPGTIKGFLNPNDSTDTYKVTLPAGILNMKLRPSSEKAYVKLEISDADGVDLAHQSAPNEGAVAKIENLNLPKAGEYIVKAASVYSNSPQTEYTLDIVPGAGAPPSADQPVPPGTPPTTPPSTPVAPTPSAPVAAPTPAVPVSGTAPAPVPVSAGGLDIQAGLKQLTFMQKAKWVLLWMLCPGFCIFLFGWIVGNVMGRGSGRRKALAQMAKQNPPPPKPAP